MNNHFAIIELYCGDSGKLGFYNSQELGISRAMTKLGYRCYVFYPDSETDSYLEQEQDGVMIVRCPAKKIGVHGFYDLDVLKRYKISYAQIDSDNQLYAPNAISYCKKHGIRFYNYLGTIGSDSDSFFKKKVSSLLMKRSLSSYKGTKCFVKTNNVLKQLQDAGVYDGEIVHVGLDLSPIPQIEEDKVILRKKLGLPNDKKILLFIGRMDPYKRPERMIEVLKKTDQDTYGIMIGDGSLSEEIDQVIESHLKDKTRRIKQIENREIHQYYKACDYFLNFNEKEIFGMSMLEAMYQGCTVIAINSPGASEIIDEKTGFIVEDTDQMIDLISRNMKKDEKIVTKRIIDSFSWDNSVRIFDQYLRRK